jgi:TolB-like protein
MPLRSLSRTPEDESFADGLTDELIYALGRAQGLRVTSRAVAFQAHDQGWTVPALARELGVDAVLQGTVRRQEGMLRVTVEVSNPKGFVVWSDRFDAPDHEHLRLQERIAATVLSRVRLDTSAMRASRIAPGPVALEAHARIYRARQLLDQQTPTALYEAQEIFLRVAEGAADYARGHSGVADCQCDLFRLGLIDHAEAKATADAAVRRALEIDPQSMEALAARATVAAWLDRDAVAAEADFGRALRLGDHARAARLYGVFLTIFDRQEEAEHLFREARAIEPFSVQQDIAEATSHYQARRHAQLIAAGPQAGVSAEVLVCRALAHVFGGDPDGARALVGAIERATAKHPDLVYARAEIEAWLGEPERGWRLLATSDTVPATAFARATLAAALNDEARGLAALNRAIDRRELSTVWLRTDSRFDAWRDRAGFQAVMDRLRPPKVAAQAG